MIGGSGITVVVVKTSAVGIWTGRVVGKGVVVVVVIIGGGQIEVSPWRRVRFFWR